MDYKIIEEPAFEVVGKSKKFTTEGGENFIKIPKFWEEFIQNKDLEILDRLADGKAGPVTRACSLGVCKMTKGNKETLLLEEFIYVIGIEKPDKEVPSDFEVFRIPAATWAVFDSIGPMPKAIQDVTMRIFREWFPSTGYEHDDKPELEVYFMGDTKAEDYHCQVWIPVVKKK